MSIPGYISSVELKDLLLSLAALVIAFSVLIGGRSIPGIETILIIVAIHFGYMAEYRANMMGLLMAMALAFVGFIFAAPGAVMISKPRAPAEFYWNDSFGQAELLKKLKRESLWISLAGPLTNIILAAAFFIMRLLSPSDGIAFQAGNFGLLINLTLAAFNLLPFGPLDGKKIFDSNRIVWIVVGLPTILLALPVYLRMI